MVKREVSTKKRRAIKPAVDPNAREKQLVNLAVNLAEKQLTEGTASPSVITHFLKLGTAQTKLETERLKSQNALLNAKTESINDVKRDKESYEQVMGAVKSYQGQSDDQD